MEVILRTTEFTPKIWKFLYKGVVVTPAATTQLLHIQDIIEEQFGVQVPVPVSADEDADGTPAPVTLTFIVPASCRDGLMIFKKQNSLQLRSLRAL